MAKYKSASKGSGMQKHSGDMPHMKGMPDKNAMVAHMKGMGKMMGNKKAM